MPGGRVAWVDASAGVAGDMLLGALVDAGASLRSVQDAVDAVIPGTVRLRVAEVQRAGTRALKLDVALLAEDQPHRHWSEIRERLGSAALAPGVRDRALAAFTALAAAEARIHGVAVDDVHFHEVGAWDSIADTVGTCAALDDLGIGGVVVSRIALGSGQIRVAHGLLSVPVPAVVELSRGWDVAAVGEGELATPTGMALLTTLAASQGPLPAMRVTASGAGAGAKDVEGRPNVVRVIVGDLDSPTSGEAGDGAPLAGQVAGLNRSSMTVLEANVDDLDPRTWPTVVDALLAAGAADAWLTPIVMKRGRPAQTLSVLADGAVVDVLRELVLTLTSTIGVREVTVARTALDRGWVDVEVDEHRVAVKVAHRGSRVVHATAEFRDVAAAAEALDRPVRDVLELATARTVEAGLVPGAVVPPDLRTQP